MPRLLLLFLAACLLAGLAAWFWLGGSSADNDRPGPRDVATVERRDLRDDIRLTGDVLPAFQVEIKPEVGGKIQKLSVRTGQEVKQGDLLVVIDDTDLLTEKAGAMTEIEGARLAVDKSRGNFERARELYQSKLISKEVFANLEADFRIAENTLAKAQRRLETVEDRLRKTRVLAPATGTILAVPVIEGQVVVAAASVNSGTSLATLADLSRLLIDTHVNQLDIEKIRSGQEVKALAPDGTQLGQARINFIAPVATVKNNIKGFQVQAELYGEFARLRPGMAVSLDIPVAEARGALAVPVSAVFEEDGSKFVYLLQDGKPRRQPVEVGAANLLHAQIVKGLQEGDRVLLTEPRQPEGGRS